MIPFVISPSLHNELNKAATLRRKSGYTLRGLCRTNASQILDAWHFELRDLHGKQHHLLYTDTRPSSDFVRPISCLLSHKFPERILEGWMLIN